MKTNVSRRNFIVGAGATSAVLASGCTSRMGSTPSYLSQVIHPNNNNTVMHWLDIVMQQTRDQRVPPPRAAYNFAMPLAAGFLAANGVLQAYHEPFGIGAGPRNANAEVAYGVAFATAASEVFGTPFMMERKAFKAKFPDGYGKTLGAQWGRKVGMHIVKMRTRDGSGSNDVNYYFDNYKRRKDIMQWKPTGSHFSASPGPAFTSFPPGLFPGQGKIKPWTMRSGDQFRVENFHHPRSPEFAREFELIRTLGGAHSPRRTKDQEEVALFWEDGPWGITPSGHFLYIAAQVLQNRNMSFIQMAQAFALLGMTQCDASICAWDNKYHHDILRPETAIRNIGHKFGNQDQRVRKHKSWNSLIPTPEFPGYTSGHSTFGAAGAELTALILGTDNVAFSGASPDLVLWPQLRGVTRRWTKLSQAADECGLSRLYGGVHWQKDHDMAMMAGRDIARHAFATTFPRRA
ncbi:MAG: hypothetical protein COA43_08420 [Robiginitomaculum sp.]|nr:MAG: hypothetical protein COA43_08420 [Robiginitomaculum sp.]